MPLSNSRIEQVASLGALIFLMFACFQVLKPFIFDLLWAAILCYVTWPLYEKLRGSQLRSSVAALCMVVPISIIFLTPFVTAAVTLTDDINRILQWLNQNAHAWPAPPEWLQQIPVIGTSLSDSWQMFGDDSSRIFNLGRQYAFTGGRWLLEKSINLAVDLLHLGLSILVLYFFYRDGESVAEHFITGITRLAGEHTQRILSIIRTSLHAVVYGILGTALVQALASLIGLLLADVPYPYVLGFISFFLAIIPAAMTLLWLPVAGWLLIQGETGWAIFICIWFILLVGTIDNWLRPILISRAVELPIILIIFGIFGGLLAFGFIGIFLGPTLLYTGFALMTDWLIRKEKESLPKVSGE
jgi:predicted PurR-regulated permease PerM